MLKSKAIDIIRTFSEVEHRRFLSFVNSPYFNNNKAIVRAIKELKRYHPEYDSEDMTEESLYKSVYGKGRYSYSAMKNLMSDLLLICDKFLIHDRLHKDLLLKEGISIELLQEYRERKLDNLFDIRSKKIEKEITKRSIDNREIYILSTKLEILKYQYYLHKHSHDKLIYQGFLEKASYELCTIFHMLYATSDTIIHSAETLGGKPEDSLMVKFVRSLDLEKFLKTFDRNQSEEYFFVNLYSKLILLTLNEKKDISENYYFEIKNSFLNNLKYFSNTDTYDILKSLRSYCLIRMKLFREKFIDEIYYIDKLLIENVSYARATSWYISEIFTEVVFLSVYKKQHEYAESFILKYKDQLNKEVMEFEIGLTRAFLDLEYGNIEKSMELLSGIKPVNNLMKVFIKHLYLRAFYELGYFEQAFSTLDAYKHFINKEEKFSKERKRNYNLQHNLFLMLFKIKLEPGKFSGYDINKLRKDLGNFYFLVDKDWYLEKLSELSKLVDKHK